MRLTRPRARRGEAGTPARRGASKTRELCETAAIASHRIDLRRPLDRVVTVVRARGPLCDQRRQAALNQRLRVARTPEPREATRANVVDERNAPRVVRIALRDDRACGVESCEPVVDALRTTFEICQVREDRTLEPMLRGDGGSQCALEQRLCRVVFLEADVREREVRPGQSGLCAALRVWRRSTPCRAVPSRARGGARRPAGRGCSV